MENNLLSIKNLSISFQKEKKWKEVVKEVNLLVKRASITAIVGESGSGKSVTSLAIMDLLDKKISKISKGEITFFDKQEDDTILPIDLTKTTSKEYRKIRGKKIAMIFQEPMTALNPVKRCGKQVEEMLLTHNNLSKQEAKQRTLNLFKEVLLPDVERVYRAYPFELSGGQRQRVMIAMAISCEPQLLIADEPTTALDVTVQDTILTLLKDLQRKHSMSILFITHDLGVVGKIADQVAVLYQGSVVEQASVKDIFSLPKQPYTNGLIASRPPLDYKPKRLLSVRDFLSEQPIQVERVSQEATLRIRQDIYKQEPLLEVEDLEVDYILGKNIFGKANKIFPALRKISFQLHKGETLGLVGESGSGKTTIGKTIVQLIKQSRGEIRFKGKNISKFSNKENKELKKHIQIIFQDPYSSLNPRKTIGEDIQEPMIVHNIYKTKEERKQQALLLLEKVGLSKDFFFRYPHELSGGQRQRVGIARALSVNPEIIICDESVSALDVSVQAQVLNLLNDLKNSYGFAYIFISHDLSVVKYMSDKIIVLKNGQIIEENYPEQIYNNPQQEYTKNLIDSIK
ncbi:MAG: ABC transporter ATP-binding protein [Bacteroidota bacterium]|nr:ABC transporter ATP-binding protein [Bacteroidota bacterium]